MGIHLRGPHLGPFYHVSGHHRMSNRQRHNRAASYREYAAQRKAREERGEMSPGGRIAAVIVLVITLGCILFWPGGME
jgi:hypothetical protein